MASIIVATAVTGVLLLAVAVFVMRGMDWRSYDFSVGREHESPADTMARWVASPVTWAVGFVVLVLGVGAVALAVVGAIELPIPGGTTTIAGTFGFLVVLFLVLGTYGALRDRDRSPAEAVATSAILVMTLFMLAVSVMLVIG